MGRRSLFRTSAPHGPPNSNDQSARPASQQPHDGGERDQEQIAIVVQVEFDSLGCESGAIAMIRPSSTATDLLPMKSTVSDRAGQPPGLSK
jgi:hypothetical protein